MIWKRGFHMETHVFYCQDTMEGIFSGVYQAWRTGMREGAEYVELRVEEPENLELFTVPHQVTVSLEQAEKVRRTIRRKLGEEILEDICFAASADDEEKGTVIFRTLWDCLSPQGELRGKRRLDHLKSHHVRRVTELHRNVWNEYHHYLGFLRFCQLPGGILYAELEPRNDLLLLFQDHFSDRFATEKWIICDTGREKMLIHRSGCPCFLVSHAGRQIQSLRTLGDVEEDYARLFAQFCDSISIPERENRKLQNQHLPLRFRGNMVEFHKKETKNMEETRKSGISRIK